MTFTTSSVSNNQAWRSAHHCSSYLGHQLLGAEVRDCFERLLDDASLSQAIGNVRPKMMEWLSSVEHVGSYDEHDLESALAVLTALVDTAAGTGTAKSALDLEICLRLHLYPQGSH